MENDLKSLAAELREAAASLRDDGSWCLGYCDSMDAAADALDALSVPSECNYLKATRQRLAEIYVPSWDQHIGKDGADAIIAALTADNTTGDLMR